MSEGRGVTVPSGPAVGPSAALNVSEMPVSNAEQSGTGSPNQGSSDVVQGLETVTAALQPLDGAQALSNSTIDFGDGTVSVGQTTVSHVYRLAGTYTILATTTDASGNSSSYTNQITVISNQPTH
jgi:PKD repeat protein